MSTNLVEEAIKLLGSEAKLAEAAGVSQVAINKAKHQVAGGGRVSAEMALRIERATGGEVRSRELRPDLYPMPDEASA